MVQTQLIRTFRDSWCPQVLSYTPNFSTQEVPSAGCHMLHSGAMWGDLQSPHGFNLFLKAISHP